MTDLPAGADAPACNTAPRPETGLSETHRTALQGLLSALPHAAWLVELRNLRVCLANERAAALFGRPVHELVGSGASELIASPEDFAFWFEATSGAVDPLDSETIVAAGDGRMLHVRRSISPMPAQDGRPELALVMLIDRGEEQRRIDEREAMLADLQATLESTADGLLVTDERGRIRACNRRFAQVWGIPEPLLARRDEAALDAWMLRSVSDAQGYALRHRALADDGEHDTVDRIELTNGTVLERVTRPLTRGGRPQGRVWSFRDLTERLAAEQRIEQLATTDAATGLPNRRSFGEQAGQALAATLAAAPGPRRGLALLVLDLDRFRQVNDTLGHTVADRVLVRLAERVQGCLRTGDLLARLGGDQFGVLLPAADARAAEAIARRILKVIAAPCRVEETEFTVTCSIGIALGPAHGHEVDDLMRHAESAMRAVKVSGRANLRMHQVRAEVDRRAHLQLEHAMRQALVAGRFRLHYQPQVGLADGRIRSAEALLRWRDPEMGEVAPARFIPVAEESGFIIALGDWVLAQAVRQAALWHQRGLDMPVAVNVSALQFRQAHFVDRVSQVLAAHGLPPRLLELELTESILVHDADDGLARLRALAGLGVRLAIDDFGTGYSSLAYLKRFPIHKLKIDRSFVHGLPADESDSAIVGAILELARALGMASIAEGVETEAQRDFLARAGCDEIQGFVVAAAMDPVSFEHRLAQQSAAPPAPAPAPATADPARPRARMRLVPG